MQSAHPRRWSALAVIALAQFMVIMDTSIIGVALPEIQTRSRLHPGRPLLGLQRLRRRLRRPAAARRPAVRPLRRQARLHRRLGRSSPSARSSPASPTTTGVEIAARAAQGAGAALIAPSALTLLMMLFGTQPEGAHEGVRVYGAAAPAGGTAGVFLGGVITEWICWPWVFYVNIPIALLVLAVTPGLMPSAPARRGSIDVAGALTATAGLALTVFGIVRAPEEGWGSAADAADASPAASRCSPRSSPSRPRGASR